MASNTRDVTHSQVELTRLAFGSCHSRGAINQRLIKSGSIKPTIWDVIGNKVKPQAFLWTGDAIYPPMKIKGDTPLNVMHEEYNQMLSNNTLGYAKFIKEKYLIGGVHGVWDDHDYGGNDRGRELKQKEDRRDAYLDFLGVPISENSRRHRRGLYSSIEFGTYGFYENTDKLHNNRVKVIFLDTRWHREKHCIPSVGANRYISFGAIISCITRWLTAGFDLPSHLPSSICQSTENAVLGEEQWIWLETELKESSASVHIIVSSIQVLTTNPVVESWGHFPAERARLLKLLNTVPGLIILSGDVHHAEVSTTSKVYNPQRRNQGSIIEVTSSGLTHSCSGPRIYGPLCEPILDLFPKHRFERGNVKDVSAPSYYTGLNFGSIDFDWKARLFEVKVHNEHGDIVLSTGNIGMDIIGNMTVRDLASVTKCIDGHFYAAANMSYIVCMAIAVFFCLRFCFTPSMSKHSYKND